MSYAASRPGGEGQGKGGSSQSVSTLQVLQQYDRSMSVALSTKVRTRYTFRGQLKVYRYCDNVWTCVLRNVEFKDSQHNNELITSEKVKIVACEASSSSK